MEREIKDSKETPGGELGPPAASAKQELSGQSLTEEAVQEAETVGTGGVNAASRGESQPGRDLVLDRLRDIQQKLGKSRGKIAIYTGNLAVGAIVGGVMGFWVTGALDCLPKAAEKVRAAVEDVGYLGHDESCFFLPPVVDSGSNVNELTRADRLINEASAALSDCRLVCRIRGCDDLERELRLARANLSLLSGDCAGSFDQMEELRETGALSSEETVTWAWGKIETDPSETGYGEAIARLGEIPDDACVATTRGALLRRLAELKDGKDKDLRRSALAEHERALSLNPRSVLANYNRAVVLVDLSEIDEAQRSLEAARDYLSRRSDPYWLLTQAKIYQLREDYEKSLKSLTEAIETRHPDSEFRLSRGWVLLALGRYNEAGQDFRRAEQMIEYKETSCLRTPPDDLRAEVRLGLAVAQYKEQGIKVVDLTGLIEASRRVTGPALRRELERYISRFEELSKESDKAERSKR